MVLGDYLYGLVGIEVRSPTLDPGFKVRKDNFFTVGRVFRVLWTEPAGSAPGSQIVSSGEIYPIAFGERAFSKIRTFVVVRAAAMYSTCVPIYTYSGRGDVKPGIDSREHCAVYAGGTPPVNRGTSLGLLPSIRVDPDDRRAILETASLINFGRVYTIEHNVKVKAFGIVNRSDLPALLRNYQRVCFPSVSILGDDSEDDDESDDEEVDDDEEQDDDE
ncbi:hypothetical protein MBLNU13_g09620t1 [Cladosporium sp. NU13]